MKRTTSAVCGLFSGLLILASGTQSANASLIFTESFEDPATGGLTNVVPTGWIDLGSDMGINTNSAARFTTPFGSQVAWANAPRQLQTSAAILSDTLAAGMVYTLSFNVARRTDLAGSYLVELMAGTSILASATGMPSFTDFSETDQIVFTADGSHTALLGETLSIRIGTGLDEAVQPQFDNFQLTAAVPEASEALVVLVGMTGLLGDRRRRRQSR